MRYEPGEPAILVIDKPSEVQAITWAASDVRAIDPHNPDASIAYESAETLYSAEIHHRGLFGHEDFVLSGEKARAMLAILHTWTESGPPQPEGQITDAARAKSYNTARAILSKILEDPSAVELISS